MPPHPLLLWSPSSSRAQSPTKARVLPFAPPPDVEKGLNLVPPLARCHLRGGGREKDDNPWAPPPPPPSPLALKTSRPLLAFLKVTLKENLFVFFIYILYFCTYCDEVSHFYRDLRLTKRGALKCVFFSSVPKANKKKISLTCGVTMSKPLLLSQKEKRRPCKKEEKSQKCKKSPIFILSIPVTLFCVCTLAVP